MSHFVTLVFKRKEDSLNEIMAPYWEGREVEKYVQYTKESAIAHVRESLEQYKESPYYKEYIKDPEVYKEKHKDNPKHIDYLENEFPKRLKWTDEECYEYIAEDYEDDKKDEEGNLYSDYNPLSKWDWFSVGGRWNDWLPTSKGNANEAYVSDILWDKLPHPPFAFIDLDGEWHQKGDMGWWGIATNLKEEEAWKKEYDNYITSLDDNIQAVVVDCHI